MSTINSQARQDYVKNGYINNIDNNKNIEKNTVQDRNVIIFQAYNIDNNDCFKPVAIAQGSDKIVVDIYKELETNLNVVGAEILSSIFKSQIKLFNMLKINSKDMIQVQDKLSKLINKITDDFTKESVEIKRKNKEESIKGNYFNAWINIASGFIEAAIGLFTIVTAIAEGATGVGAVFAVAQAICGAVMIVNGLTKFGAGIAQLDNIESDKHDNLYDKLAESGIFAIFGEKSQVAEWTFTGISIIAGGLAGIAKAGKALIKLGVNGIKESLKKISLETVKDFFREIPKVTKIVVPLVIATDIVNLVFTIYSTYGPEGSTKDAMSTGIFGIISYSITKAIMSKINFGSEENRKFAEDIAKAAFTLANNIAIGIINFRAVKHLNLKNSSINEIFTSFTKSQKTIMLDTGFNKASSGGKMINRVETTITIDYNTQDINYLKQAVDGQNQVFEMLLNNIDVAINDVNSKFRAVVEDITNTISVFARYYNNRRESII